MKMWVLLLIQLLAYVLENSVSLWKTGSGSVVPVNVYIKNGSYGIY